MKIVFMKRDDVAWERSDQLWEIWKSRLWAEGVTHQVAMLIKKYLLGSPTELHPPFSGSHNVGLRLEFRDGSFGMIRFAVSGRIMFPEEKNRTEVATMRFIAAHTTIPIPLVHHVGTSEEAPGGLGPFIIMDYIEHTTDLGGALNIPGRSNDERVILDPDIEEEKLELLYRQMTEVLIQLWQPSLPCIGSFSETGESQSVTERPLTYNVNELATLGDVSFDRLPSTTYSTSLSYYCALADMHLEHLSAQQNDAITSEVDCRYKYVAQQLFRNLAAEGRLDPFPEFGSGPFKLFCEDLRPTNFLVTQKYTLKSVIDWEFTIAAPVGFTFSPPWWLLLERPENWSSGLDDWELQYARRLDTWLRTLKDAERSSAERGILIETLSDRMRQSWETGAFWVHYVLQRSWAFDPIYFGRLDEMFFGKVKGDWLTARLMLLTEAQRQGMEPFVKRKMAQKADRRLVDERFDAFI